MIDNNLNDHQVYNCDETALYFRMLPTTTLDVNNSINKSGLKINKVRVTLLFATNKSGSHKVKPLCIGAVSYTHLIEPTKSILEGRRVTDVV